mgnify:CR=1 FL=1
MSLGLPDATTISTIVLNWNRADLLRATLRSYAETAREPFDITVVDNASTDHSRTAIEDAKRAISGLRAVYNAGGCERLTSTHVGDLRASVGARAAPIG